MTFSVSYFGKSDIGKKRDTNQDHFLLARLQKAMVVDHSNIPEGDHGRFQGETDGRLLLVADGMGGYAGGELASQIAVDAAATYVLNTIPWFYRMGQDCDDNFQGELKQALEFAQEQIVSAVQSRPEQQDMGTTLTMAYVVGRWLFVVHVGDSRCYLSRGDRLHQITHDHTVAQKLVEQGMMSRETAETSPMSHVLWNAIGAGERSSHNPDVYKAPIVPGDYVLVCSDGLTKHVTDKQILAELTRDSSVDEKCATLIDLANEAGGTDNITVAIAAIEGDPETLPDLRHETWHGKTLPPGSDSGRKRDPGSTEVRLSETMPHGQAPNPEPPQSRPPKR